MQLERVEPIRAHSGRAALPFGVNHSNISSRPLKKVMALIHSKAYQKIGTMRKLGLIPVMETFQKLMVESL